MQNITKYFSTATGLVYRCTATHLLCNILIGMENKLEQMKSIRYHSHHKFVWFNALLCSSAMQIWFYLQQAFYVTPGEVC